MIKKIYRKISFKMLFLTCIFFPPRFKISHKLFDFFKNQSLDLIYFASYNQKKSLLNFIKKRQKIENRLLSSTFDNEPLDNIIESVLVDLNNSGISENFSVEIADNEITKFIEQMKKSYYYDNHVPTIETKKNPDTKPTGAYKSYDYSTQLNNITLLKLCTNSRIVKLAEQYLGVIPKIYSINTFNTLPGQKAFTHNFHRDIDNLKWLVVFIYWTKTNNDDGAFEQIEFTHKPSEELKNILKDNKNLYPNNFDSFFKKTTSYDNKDQYQKIFHGKIKKVFGNPGKIVACDTAGLHRGTPVKSERLVTWIRYGAIDSRQKILNLDESLKQKIILDEKNMQFLSNSKYKQVLSDIVHFN